MRFSSPIENWFIFLSKTSDIWTNNFSSIIYPFILNNECIKKTNCYFETCEKFFLGSMLKLIFKIRELLEI